MLTDLHSSVYLKPLTKRELRQIQGKLRAAERAASTLESSTLAYELALAPVTSLSWLLWDVQTK